MKKPIYAFKALAAILSVFIVTYSNATNYYFSSSDGDDSRSFLQAQSSLTPWKSLAKLNAISSLLKAGDTVFFKSGEVYSGSIFMNGSGTASSPVVFTSYGSGARPVISGLTSFTNWNSLRTNVWQTTIGATEPNIVLVNGSFYPIGRYPNNDAGNGGYLPVENYSGNSAVSNNSLSNGTNWNGGEVVIRKNRWILDRNNVTNHSGNTIYYTSASGYHASNGYGFFMQNHPAALDKQGEWYYQDQKLGIFLNGLPSSYAIQASSVDVLVSITNERGIVFNGLEFRGANKNAFEINNSNNISIINCAVLYSGVNAFEVSNTNALIIESTEIDYTNNIALNISNCWNAVVKNNTITNTGITPGMGNSGDGTYEAILISGSSNLVEGNTIENTGYIPISFNGSQVTVKNNFIKNFSVVKDDGGGIYTWNNTNNPPNYNNRTVVGNIILNGHSANDGTNSNDKKFSHGIYLDDNAANVDVINNTVAGCEGFGIYVHNANSNTIKQNTIYNNTVQLAIIHDDIAPTHPVRNTVVSDNIFFSLHASQIVAEYKSRANDIADFGTFENNYYSRPLDENTTIGVLKNVNGSYSYQLTDVEGWKAMYGKDAGSQTSPKTFAPYVINNVNGANKFSNGNFANNIGGLYAYAPANNCQTAWSNGQLDGGCLAVSFSLITNSSKGTVVIGAGNVSAGKKYLLRFSLKGADENKMLDVYLRKSGAPYNDVTERKATKIKSQRKEVELLFTANETVADASIGIDVLEQSTPVFFDNIELKEVTATDINIADSVTFIYNATNNAASTSLNGNYIDVKTTSYNNSVSVPAYSSIILLATAIYIPPPLVICSATGNILRERWLGIPGNDVWQIPVSLPAITTDNITSFEVPPNTGDNYGTRIRGYLCAPQTGYYTFYISGDDGIELWLSTDDNPTNKTRIAYSLSWTNFREWTKYSSQKSTAIYLEAGRKYYIEALQKEGGGGDHVSVAWQMPGNHFEAPIAGTRLSPFVSATTCSATGFILREQWDNIDGNDVIQIPQQNNPSFASIISQFEGPVNADDKYGSRISGYICAPQTGNYIFWIAGDDGTELWLSSNDNPVNKKMIAYGLSWTDYREWNKFTSQQSAGIYLEAGKKYYIEALQKEGNGGDHLSVAWQLPDGNREAPIGGKRLSPYLGGVLQTSANSKTTTFNAGRSEQAGITNSVLSCYPNPFTDKVRIEITLTNTEITTVEIYDVSGRKLKTLFSGLLQKGTKKQFTWQKPTDSAGVYFVRYTSANEVKNYKLFAK